MGHLSLNKAIAILMERYNELDDETLASLRAALETSRNRRCAWCCKRPPDCMRLSWKDTAARAGRSYDSLRKDVERWPKSAPRFEVINGRNISSTCEADRYRQSLDHWANAWRGDG